MQVASSAEKLTRYSEPNPEALYDAARALVLMIRDEAQNINANGRISDEIAQAIKDAGLFRILQPKRWGGYEMSPAVFYHVQTILAEGDMSVGWCYGIVGVHNWHLGIFDDRAAQDVWEEDDSVLISSTYMPVGKVTPVEGGYRLSGRWKFSSGCDICQWVLLGAMLPYEDDFESGTLLLPRSDYQIVDGSWEVGGLRGTGSKDIIVEDAFVPAYRTHRHRQGYLMDSPGNAVNDSPLYRIPFAQVFMRAVNGSAIGALQALAEAAADYASTRVSPFGGLLADNQSTQVAIGEAMAAVVEMRAVLHADFAELWKYAVQGIAPPDIDRTIFKYHAANTTTRSVDLAMKLYRVFGGTGLYTDFPFSRMVDDIVASRQHQFNQDFPFAAAIGAVAAGKANTDFFV